MPFWKRSCDRPSKGEIETLQDAKLSLAENLPEHAKIIDLSQIYLLDLPHNILSVVKHQNKECLILKNNELKDLKGSLDLLEDLKKLDLSFNLFRNVPKNLPTCQNLIYLNLDHNELCELPWLLGALHKLEILSACSNKIRKVAPEIGALRNLHSLHLKDNEITSLPDNFVHCYKLVNLDMDVEKMTYPPGEVIMMGGRSTVLWLCEKNEVDSSQITNCEEVYTYNDINQQEREAEASMLRRQENVAEETNEMLAQLREEEETMRRISEHTNAIEEQMRKNIQMKLAEENAREHKKLSEYLAFQNDVKLENIRKALEEVEDKDLDAARILAEVERMRAKERESLKKYVAEDEAILKDYVNNNRLDMSFISQEMEKVLLEEQMMSSFTRNAEQELKVMFDLVQEEGKQEYQLFSEMARNVDKDKGKILQIILEDESLQRKMFITAQQDQDKMYKALSTQIESVQENLMLLTILENKQKELEDHVIADVRVQRQEMAGLLTSLMEAQHERRLELEEATRQIEDQYQDELANFWLYQYQMLMAAKPAKVLTEEEEALRAASKATKLEKPLQGEEYQGPAVLPDAWNIGPTAPPVQSPGPHPSASPCQTPTAPPNGSIPEATWTGAAVQAESECCICLDQVPSVAFLPCGHVCCCYECGIVTICPMCRAPILNTVRLFFTQNT